jgi:urease accessory protein
VLRHGAGRSDALFFVAAYQADDPGGVDAMARAYSASAERLKETVLQGEAFVRATSDIWHHDLPSLTYPVAVGRAARLEGLPLNLALSMYLQAVMSNLVAAGMRLIPLGQTEGQGIIRAQTPVCVEIAQSALHGSLDDLSSTAFMADIASMKHEIQYSRIFRT